MEKMLRGAIQTALQGLGAADVAFAVEHPADLAHGDYATNAALSAAKQLKKNPRDVAEMLVDALRAANLEAVEKIEIAGPGFINFTLTRDYFAGQVEAINADPDAWGSNTFNVGQKVVVEYTDPNPFKEMHIGHMMTNAIGESVSRLVEMSGAETHRANYQGDVGLHVAKAIYGMLTLGFSADTLTAAELGRAYARGATLYEEDEAAKDAIVVLNKKIYERSDTDVNTLYDHGKEVSLAYFEELYAILGTSFDHYFFESEAGPRGKELVLARPDIFPESDGARVFKGEAYGLHTRVFLNKEGLPTYEAKELGLAQTKYEAFPYDHSLIITANEINEYFKVLLKAMSFVYPELAEKTEHIGHGVLKLTTGKMSSRTGDVIAAADFIRELSDMAKERMRDRDIANVDAIATQIAVAAFKYTVLKGSIRQDVTFDPEQSLSFEGASGPYLQYTAVRAGTVLAKAHEVGVEASIDRVPPQPYMLERLIYQFPEVVERALEEREPHHVVTFLTELAAAFNAFYAQERIADPADANAPYKAALTQALRHTLVRGLYLLGIAVPEKM